MSSEPAAVIPVDRTAPERLLARLKTRREGGWALAGGYLACFAAGQGAYLLLSPSGQASFLSFASTSVANLTRDPVGCLAASPFVTGGNVASTMAWLPMIAIALYGTARLVGPWRALGTMVAGHIVGTLVSEGLVAWQVTSGALPESYRHLTDVGPSYAVVSALVLAVLPRGDDPPITPRNFNLSGVRFAGGIRAIGRPPQNRGTSAISATGPGTRVPRGWDAPKTMSWTWRGLAAADLGLLVFPGHIFSGLSGLDVAAVGHATATATAALAAMAVVLLRRRRQPETAPPTASPIR